MAQMFTSMSLENYLKRVFSCFDCDCRYRAVCLSAFWRRLILLSRDLCSLRLVPTSKMSIFFLLIDTVPYLRCPPILGLHPAAGIWLIGLHSAPLFDIDLIIIAFFPEPPLPSAVLSYPADKSWVVLGLLQNWQELNPLNTNNTQIHTHKYTNTGTNTHIQIQKVGIWYLPSAQSVV